jgi:hypothetical protein
VRVRSPQPVSLAGSSGIASKPILRIGCYTIPTAILFLMITMSIRLYLMGFCSVPQHYLYWAFCAKVICESISLRIDLGSHNLLQFCLMTRGLDSHTVSYVGPQTWGQGGTRI